MTTIMEKLQDLIIQTENLLVDVTDIAINVSYSEDRRRFSCVKHREKESIDFKGKYKLVKEIN